MQLRDLKISPSAVQKVPARFATHYKVMPLELKDNCLVLAMSDPADLSVLDDLRLLLGIDIEAIKVHSAQIEEAIAKHYGLGAETLEGILSAEPSSGYSSQVVQEAEDLGALVEDSSIIKFVNQILTQALKERATDIHIEPFSSQLQVRFRIDGVIYNINTPQVIRRFHPAIVSRIKIMAGLNIAEHRLPQDGRIKVKLGEAELDLRISILPTAFGEAAHIRVLISRFFLDLENLGFKRSDLQIIEQVIKRPHGVIFVTGPTGSGKTTTLYASLARINSDAVKIITVEDPIEYQLKGLNQIQVNPKIGLGFATALRHMLRHDPDVMMVGEVRDFETAEIAIRAALTGHLVFSSLHTNDAAGAITRLLDMGVEPFLISSSLECLVAQRLVRIICSECKAIIKYDAQTGKQIKDLGFDPGAALYAGKGCPECRFSGYQGRTGIYEIFNISDNIRKLILKRASSHEIKEKAVSEGMRTLRQDGLDKVVKGVTTLSEVLRLTAGE